MSFRGASTARRLGTFARSHKTERNIHVRIVGKSGPLLGFAATLGYGTSTT